MLDKTCIRSNYESKFVVTCNISILKTLFLDKCAIASWSLSGKVVCRLIRNGNVVILMFVPVATDGKLLVRGKRETFQEVTNMGFVKQP